MSGSEWSSSSNSGLLRLQANTKAKCRWNQGGGWTADTPSFSFALVFLPLNAACPYPCGFYFTCVC